MFRLVFLRLILLSAIFACGVVCADDPPKFHSEDYLAARARLEMLVPEERQAAVRILEKTIFFMAEKGGCEPGEIRVYFSNEFVILEVPDRPAGYHIMAVLFAIRSHHVREVYLGVEEYLGSEGGYVKHFPEEFDREFLETVGKLSRLKRLDFGPAKLDADGLAAIEKLESLNRETRKSLSADYPMKSPAEDYQDAVEKLAEYLVPEEREAAKRVLDWSLDFIAERKIAKPEGVDVHVGRDAWGEHREEPETIYLSLNHYEGARRRFEMNLFAIRNGHIADINLHVTEYPDDFCSWANWYPINLSRELLEDVGTFTKLKKLWLYGAWLEPEGIAALGNLKELEELDISSFQAADLEMLADFPHLKKLTHYDAKESDVRHDELWKRNRLTKEKLEKLAGFKNLESLSLCLDYTEASAEILKDFPELASHAWVMPFADEEDEVDKEFQEYLERVLDE